MAKTINGITFNNLSRIGKGSSISNVKNPDIFSETDLQEFIDAGEEYRNVQSVLIDWNGAEWPATSPITAPPTINNTADLIKAVKYASTVGGTEYVAGDGITFESVGTGGPTIKVNTTVVATQTDLAGKQNTMFAGAGIDIVNGDTITVDTNVVATQLDLADKQNKLTAGNNISITNNTIACTIGTPNVNTLGLIKTGYNESDNNYAVKVDSNGKAYVTVNATQQQPQYTVIFVDEYSDNPYYVQTGYENETYSIPTLPIVTGYTNVGWNTKPSASTSVTPSGTFSNSNETYYAIRSEITHLSSISVAHGTMYKMENGDISTITIAPSPLNVAMSENKSYVLYIEPDTNYTLPTSNDYVIGEKSDSYGYRVSIKAVKQAKTINITCTEAIGPTQPVTVLVQLDIQNGSISDGMSNIQNVVEGQIVTWSVTADTGYNLPTTITNGTISNGVITSTEAGTDNITVRCVCVKPTTYTVKFIDELDNRTYQESGAEGKEITVAPLVTKEGYTNIGWREADASTAVNFPTPLTIGTVNVTYYDLRTPITYAVTVNVTGGTIDGQTTKTYNVNHNSSQAISVTLNSEKYVISNVSGYYDYDTNNNIVTIKHVKANLTINIICKEQHTVTFKDKYNGSDIEITSAVGIEGKSFIVPNVPTDNPIYAEHYIAQGWHTNYQSTVAQLIPQTSYQFGNSNVSYYAIRTPREYTVIFDVTHGDAPTSDTITYGKALDVIISPEANYEVSNAYNLNNQSQKFEVSGNKVTVSGITEDTTVKVICTEIVTPPTPTRNVTFIDSQASPTVNVTYSGAVSTSITLPPLATVTGYESLGWDQDSTKTSNPKYALVDGSFIDVQYTFGNQDETLYAIRTQVTQPVTYDVTLELTNGTVDGEEATSTDSVTISTHQVASGQTTSWTIIPNVGYEYPSSVTNGTISGNVITSNTVSNSDMTVVAVCTASEEPTKYYLGVITEDNLQSQAYVNNLIADSTTTTNAPMTSITLPSDAPSNNGYYHIFIYPSSWGTPSVMNGNTIVNTTPLTDASISNPTGYAGFYLADPRNNAGVVYNITWN